MPDPSLDLLARFFATSPAARQAIRPLAASARVALRLDEGPAGFTIQDGEPRFSPGPLDDPDFTIRLPVAAVERLVAIPGDDVGLVGVAFFQGVLEAEPARRIGLTIQAPSSRLVAHGYLGVLARGGVRVGLFLLRRGLADARAIIERLRTRPP
jgi:hypothetical protein